MRVRLIIGQYPVRYEGELMPNVLDAWDEFTMDDNYEGYQAKVAEYTKWVQDGDLAAMREVDIVIPDDTLLGLFTVPIAKIQVNRA